jgi:DNA adenine methylase
MMTAPFKRSVIFFLQRMILEMIVESPTQAKPVLKWAGGKTQMINELMKKAPANFNKYIEPFFGGGALFFHLQPERAIIADSNPELVNLYQCLADSPELIINALASYQNEETFFYEVRAQIFEELSPYEAAARTLFLNRTCFNGLYRVNKKGQFNVPFGRYTNPKIGDPEVLYAASDALKKASIYGGDYKAILKQHAEPGDFIFLDPPYLPISEHSDFKRYTKEQFHEQDHRELAEEVHRLHEMGCYVLLTNSNHPLVHNLYSSYDLQIHQTKRNINSKAGKRTGEDILVSVSPKPSSTQGLSNGIADQIRLYPSTRWMGSKSKLITNIAAACERFQYDSVLDLFSGSGTVSYLFKTLGKQVISNDYMALSALYTKAMVENNSTTLDLEKAKQLLQKPAFEFDSFVQDTFSGIYFTDEENIIIDILRANIKGITNEYEKAIALAALVRTCTKKRPRGIFTYVGHRYDDGRKDLQMSFEDQFIKAIEEINGAIFNNGQVNISLCEDAMQVTKKADLVYLDPPYYSPLSDNEYVRRYHFVEGLACDWKDREIQWHTKTKKFKSYPTPFSSHKGAYDAFDKLFNDHKDSILIVSYSSNSLPTLDDIVTLLSKYKEKVEVVKIDYRYSFGTQKEGTAGNKAQEYLFIAY